MTTEVPLVTGPRRRVQSISGWTTLISPVVCLASYIYGPFWVTILFWFVAWLGFFHWLLAGRATLTQKQVRLIDYPYLATAMIALLLAAAEYQTATNEYFNALDDLRFPNSIGRLQEYLGDRHQVYCSSRDTELNPQPYCRWIEDLRRFFSQSPTPDQIHEKARAARALIDAEGWDSVWTTLMFFLREFGESQRTETSVRHRGLSSGEARNEAIRHIRYLSGRGAQDIVYWMTKIANHGAQVTATTQTRPGQRITFDDVLWGLASNFGWPFVLAIALALRVTKVTAEAFNWPRS